MLPAAGDSSCEVQPTLDPLLDVIRILAPAMDGSLAGKQALYNRRYVRSTRYYVLLVQHNDCSNVRSYTVRYYRTVQYVLYSSSSFCFEPTLCEACRLGM